jgi:RimJ/RimL family protein N-acetyltransferase
MLIYRLDLTAPLSETPLSKGAFVQVEGVTGVRNNLPIWVKNWGWAEALKTSLKIISRKRIFFGIVSDTVVVQRGWANLGFCRYYSVERDSVVLGSLYTAPDHRAQGLASAAMRRSINELFRRGHRRFYVDTSQANIASQRMIQKTGFSQPL